MIEVSRLTKRFGARTAVDDLSFTVAPGVVTGFLGPNGAGKSTTMRLMLGLDRGEGTTLFDGQPYASLHDPLTEVGALLEAKGFHPTRSARDHLRMLAASSRVPDARVDEVLEVVGLTSVARSKPKSFSLGMGQRLGLAAALLGQPKVLLLDEPANGLDPQGIHWLRSFLRSYAEQGRTVFVSSHLLSEMQLMADHLVVIGKGRLISDSSVADFVASASPSAVVVRSPQGEALAQALRRRGGDVAVQPDGALTVSGMALAAVGDTAFAEGLPLHELTQRSASLEEAFIELTGASEEFQGRPEAAAVGSGAPAAPTSGPDLRKAP
jgi:ABC-2 type transport system ATP-binding protein